MSRGLQLHNTVVLIYATRAANNFDVEGVDVYIYVSILHVHLDVPRLTIDVIVANDKKCTERARNLSLREQIAHGQPPVPDHSPERVAR